ncbi:MAG: type II secretion system F family protein [Clostridiales Family XIII bacterium]|jgi:type IV pilus assembly protein PilC|nr:type II secretion system F family protein [Clostridiales Family XIII bacterium]
MSKHTRALPAGELSAFSEQLSLTVKTGIPLEESIMILREDSDTDAAKKLLGTVEDALAVGKPLADALRETGAFPDYMTQMIEIGEAAGRLDSVLDSLANYYARQENIAKSIRSAVTYPAIMLCILVAIVLVLVIKVLPIFNEVFRTVAGADMPPFARAAMSFGQGISRYAVVVIGVIAAIAVALLILRLTAGGRRALSGFGRKLFKKLSLTMASGKFASAMSLMLASGVDTDRGVELTLPLMDNPDMRAKVARLKEACETGGSFSENVVSAGIFTGMEARMLTLGFRSGNLDTVMEKIAAGYETQTEDRLDTAISVIEPTMVAVLCVIVGLILLSAMLPLIAVMQSAIV